MAEATAASAMAQTRRGTTTFIATPNAAILTRSLKFKHVLSVSKKTDLVPVRVFNEHSEAQASLRWLKKIVGHMCPMVRCPPNGN